MQEKRLKIVVVKHWNRQMSSHETVRHGTILLTNFDVPGYIAENMH